MYTLRVPFDLSDMHAVGATNERIDIGWGQARIERSERRHALVVEGLLTVQDAKALLHHLKAGLRYASVKTWFPLSASYELEQVVAIPPGAATQTADGSSSLAEVVVDDGLPAFYETGAGLRRVFAFPATVEQRMPGNTLLTAIREGLDLAKDAPSDPKLELAIDLYVSHYREATGNGRFLTLVTALESLCESAPRPPAALELLEHMRQRLDAALAALDQEAPSADKEALLALGKELNVRSKDSIASQLRRLIRAALSADPNVEEAVKMMGEVYGVRSTLVHTGRLPAKLKIDHYKEALLLVQRVLRARLAGLGRGTVGIGSA